MLSGSLNISLEPLKKIHSNRKTKANFIVNHLNKKLTDYPPPRLL